MANQNLGEAKKAKNDEFYTQFRDIEREINAYLEFDRDAFRDKVLLLPCDDPEWSNFTKYFAINFDKLGLKKLISTSYAPNSKPSNVPYAPTLFELEDVRFDTDFTRSRGKIFTLEKDRNGDNRINIDDLSWEYLEGDGDFRSDEVRALRDSADIVVTNPPFSLFREFLKWIFEAKKKFIVIGTIHSITTIDVFPYVLSQQMWFGNGFHAGNAFFSTPVDKEYADGVFDSETGLVKFRNVIWLTNMDHGRRHEPLVLMTAEETIKFAKDLDKFYKYDNFDCIEVPKTKYIPGDYDGVMGVPVSFLAQHNPEQYQLLGMTGGRFAPEHLKIPGQPKYDRPYLNGKRMFPRLFIQKL